MNKLKENELIPTEYRYEGKFKWYEPIKAKDFIKWLENIPDSTPLINIKNISFWCNYIFYVEINENNPSSNETGKNVKDLKNWILSQKGRNDVESEIQCSNNFSGIIGFKYNDECLIAIPY